MTTVAPPLTSPDLNWAALPLSAAMREGSMAEHKDAEGSAFMALLLDGKITPAGYAAYLLRYRQVYVALESRARELATDPLVAAVYDPVIERLGAIDADLAHFFTIAPDAPREVNSPAASAYVARLTTASAPQLVAHHYTRYLGDLSGGQAIGRIIDRSYDLGGHGVAFYDFPDIAKPKIYKDGYRTRLDDLGLSPEAKAEVVEEVKEAFRCNQAIFAELGEHLEEYTRRSPPLDVAQFPHARWYDPARHGARPHHRPSRDVGSRD